MGTGEIYNTIIRKYPKNRDSLIRGCWSWLQSRRADDGAEGLWRVHDKLYDLKDFVSKHPGGKDWLLLTKGIDITEAFESTHLSSTPKTILSKYYIRDAATPRNYRLTFDEDGFYQTLKRKVLKKLPSLDKSVTNKSKRYFDMVLLSAYILSILTIRVDNALIKGALTVLSGLFMSWVITISHNFVHQKNNFRMYFSNITLYNWRDWRIFHVLSHHFYPNSFADLQISYYEPLLKWIPVLPKSPLQITFSLLASPIVYVISPVFNLISRLQGMLFSETKVFYWDELLELSVPAVMLIFSGKPYSFSTLIEVVKLWSLILAAIGFFYSINALNTGHHGTNITHEGDEFTSLDFGLYQLAATIDRIEANSNLFISLALFGEHTLHHLFPVLDHALLPHLHEEYLETCREFEVEIRKITLSESVAEQFKQLARTEIIRVK